MILLMAVLDTKCILFSCVQSGYADQRRHNCRRILLLRPSTERCLATVTAVPATTSSPAPSPPPRSSRAVRYRNSSTRQRVAAFGSFGTNATRLPPPQAQQVCWEPRRKWKHQHQHQGDKAVVVVMPRRTLRFSSSTFDQKQQEQQYGHDRNSTERKPEHHTDGEANVDHVRRAQLGSAARGGSGSSDRSEEEMTKPAIDKVRYISDQDAAMAYIQQHQQCHSGDVLFYVWYCRTKKVCRGGFVPARGGATPSSSIVERDMCLSF